MVELYEECGLRRTLHCVGLCNFTRNSSAVPVPEQRSTGLLEQLLRLVNRISAALLLILIDRPHIRTGAVIAARPRSKRLDNLSGRLMYRPLETDPVLDDRTPEGSAC